MEPMWNRRTFSLVEEDSSGQRCLQELLHIFCSNTDKTGGFMFTVNCATCLGNCLPERFIESNSLQEMRLTNELARKRLVCKVFCKSESKKDIRFGCDGSRSIIISEIDEVCPGAWFTFDVVHMLCCSLCGAIWLLCRRWAACFLRIGFPNFLKLFTNLVFGRHLTCCLPLFEGFPKSIVQRSAVRIIT